MGLIVAIILSLLSNTTPIITDPNGRSIITDPNGKNITNTSTSNSIITDPNGRP